MKLIDFILILLLKILHFAMFRLNDYYLITNIHAIFMNLVRQFHSIHSYTTERMMKTLILLCKKMMKKITNY